MYPFLLDTLHFNQFRILFCFLNNTIRRITTGFFKFSANLFFLRFTWYNFFKAFISLHYLFPCNTFFICHFNTFEKGNHINNFICAPIQRNRILVIQIQLTHLYLLHLFLICSASKMMRSNNSATVGSSLIRPITCPAQAKPPSSFPS